MAYKIQLRRDTALNFTNTNPILAQGEPALETDTLKEKIGNGVDNWITLPYRYQAASIITTRITNTNVSGTYNLDHSLASAWVLTLTGDTTITDSNLPTGTDTINFTVKVTGDFVFTAPPYWGTPTGDVYRGTLWNYYAIQVENGNVGSEDLTVFLSNLS